MFRWAYSCGLSGEYDDVPITGRACGSVRSGAHQLLPFAGLVPIAMRRQRPYFGAIAVTLVAFLGVAFVLAPSP
jgi:hypothetical protein